MRESQANRKCAQAAGTQVEAALACPGQCPAPVLLPATSSPPLLLPLMVPTALTIFGSDLEPMPDLSAYYLRTRRLSSQMLRRRKSQYAEIPPRLISSLMDFGVPDKNPSSAISYSDSTLRI